MAQHECAGFNVYVLVHTDPYRIIDFCIMQLMINQTNLLYFTFLFKISYFPH